MTCEYQQQAADFCLKHKVRMRVQYDRTAKYFPEDKEKRDIYKITITRDGLPFKWVFEFGQSLINTLGYVYKARGKGQRVTKRTAPNEYDVLAAITKSDPGSFKDFCSEFGYSDDSIQAFSTYKKVKEEWIHVHALFGGILDELREFN